MTHMRIAILSDIHGNSIGLDAVLADIQAQGGVDDYWLLGDYCALGANPVGVLERVTKLPNASFIYGNADYYLAHNTRPSPTPEDVLANPSLLPQLAEMLQSFAWSQGAVTGSGWLPWLTALPLEVRLTLPDGTRVLLVHASPGSADDDRLWPNRTDAELKTTLADCNADLICVGHTHWVVDRVVDGVRIINPGSVSNQPAPDLRASYMLLEADTSGYQVQVRRVDYDHDAVIEQLRQMQHPGGNFISLFIRGQMQAPWLRK
jgi:predicted phosphodiesterase